MVAARTADRLPQLGAMLTAGDISVDHVAAVGFSTSRVPSEVVSSYDDVFSTLAASASPSELRVAGKHLRAVYDTDAISRDANHARDSRFLTLAPTIGGVWHLEGKLAPEDGLALSLAVDSLSSKRGADDERTAAQRRADGLVELAALAVRAGELPDTGGDQPRVTLLLQATTNPFADLEDEALDEELSDAVTGSLAPDCSGSSGLRRGRHLAGKVSGGNQFSVSAFDLADAQLLGAAAMMSAETLQRICCDAEFNIATQDATGNILNLGRSCRDPNLAQKRAVKIRDKHCVFPGCDTPPNRCQVHHLHFWGEGGRTDLCNLALVCAFHHRLVHEYHWALAVAPPTPDHPAGGWIATAPDGYEIGQWRQPIP